VNEEGYTLKGAKAALKSADRRKEERRQGDRREDGGDQAPLELGAEAIVSHRSPKEVLALADAIPQLKAVRARLAAVLEA